MHILHLQLKEKGNPQDSSLYSMLADVSIAVGQFHGKDIFKSLCPFELCQNLQRQYFIFVLSARNKMIFCFEKQD